MSKDEASNNKFKICKCEEIHYFEIKEKFRRNQKKKIR